MRGDETIFRSMRSLGPMKNGNSEKQGRWTAESLRNTLFPYRFRFSTEKDLQDGIESVLVSGNISYQREVHLGSSDRPDFMVGGVAVEVKIAGSLSALVRQIFRYAKYQQVESILVIGSPSWIPKIVTELNGKPVCSIYLLGSLL